MTNARHTVRNLDRDLVLDARVYALQTGRTLGELINLSLEQHLTSHYYTQSDENEHACVGAE